LRIINLIFKKLNIKESTLGDRIFDQSP